MTASEARCTLPGLNGDGLTGAAYYLDAQTQDARLVIDTLRSAANHHAVLRNYCSYQKATRAKNSWQVEVHDHISGESHTIQAAAIVNATGPWSPVIPNSGTRLRLTKGVHLVVERRRLLITDAAVLTEGKRILFLIPWGSRLIIGTTDTDYDGPIANPEVTREDIHYLLGEVNRWFPELILREDEVKASWAGLRPLVAKADGSPSDISRKHEISSPQPGWYDVTGGKLTTYRLIAEQTVDRLMKDLGRSAVNCMTASTPLIKDCRYSGIIPPDPTNDAIDWFIDHEWAMSVEDIMHRRVAWATYADNPGEVAGKVLRRVQERGILGANI